jgi:predicted NBD/HSP70 family sugar kinase
VWGAKASNLLHVEWSRGIGGGLVLGGRLYRGAGIAGELGHIVVAPEDARRCPHCGRAGCLEAVAGLRAVASDALGVPSEHIEPEHVSTLLDPHFPDPARVSRAFERAAGFMARALGTALNLLNPDLVIIGGEVGRLAYDRVRGTLLKEIGGYTIRPALADASIQATTLSEDAALRGAVALVLVSQPGEPDPLLSFMQSRARLAVMAQR